MYEFYGPAGDTTVVRSRIKIVPDGTTFAIDSSGFSADGTNCGMTGSPLTFACWVVGDTLNTQNGCAISLSNKRPTVNNTYDDYQLGYASANGFRMAYASGATRQSAAASFASLNLTSGDLVHLAGTCVKQAANNRGILRLYVNGDLVSTLTAGAGILPELTAAVTGADGMNRVVIGCSFSNLTAIGTNGGENYWDGRIGEVGMWNVELTADEIKSLSDGFRCSQVRPQNLKLYMPLAGERNLIEGDGCQASLEVRAAAPTEKPNPSNTHPPRYG